MNERDGAMLVLIESFFYSLYYLTHPASPLTNRWALTDRTLSSALSLSRATNRRAAAASGGARRGAAPLLSLAPFPLGLLCPSLSRASPWGADGGGVGCPLSLLWFPSPSLHPDLFFSSPSCSAKEDRGERQAGDQQHPSLLRC
ncbi:hypothetical protein ACQJBY_050390 [Aegilops geniculata]